MEEQKNTENIALTIKHKLKTINISVPRDASTIQIKEKIKEEIKYELDEQRIIYKGIL